MVAAPGILVAFPPYGRLYAHYEPGKSLHSFKRRIESQFLSHYSMEIRVDELVVPASEASEEAVLPADDDAAQTLAGLDEVVASFAVLRDMRGDRAAASGSSAPEPRRRRFDRRFEQAGISTPSPEDDTAQNVPVRMPVADKTLGPQVGQTGSLADGADLRSSLQEDEFEALGRQREQSLREQHAPATLNASRRLHPGWRHHRSSMPSKAALGSVEEVDEELELEEQEQQDQEVDQMLREEQVYVPGSVRPWSSARLEVLHESEEEDQLDEEDVEELHAARVAQGLMMRRHYNRFPNTPDTIEEEDEDELEDDEEEGEFPAGLDEDESDMSDEDYGESTEQRLLRLGEDDDEDGEAEEIGGDLRLEEEDEDAEDYREVAPAPPMRSQRMEAARPSPYYPGQAGAYGEAQHRRAENPRVFRLGRPSPDRYVVDPVLEQVQALLMPMDQVVAPDADDLDNLSFSDEEPGQTSQASDSEGNGKGKGKGKVKGKGKGKGKGKFKAPPRFVLPELGKDRKIELNPRAVDSAEAEEKQAVSFRMQRTIHKEIDKKRSSSAGRRRPSREQRKKVELVLAVLQDSEFTEEDAWGLCERCEFNMDAVEVQVEAILAELQEASQHPEGNWMTSVTRRHNRELDSKERQLLELNYLESHFGKLLQDLEQDLSSNEEEPEVTPEPGQATASPWKKVQGKQKSAKERGQKKADKSKPLLTSKPRDKLEDLKRQWRERDERRDMREEAEESGPPDGAMPEETSVQMMNRIECRNLLLRMKPLTKPPVRLYEVLAKRAVQEYVKFKPKSFHDVWDVTFWQFTSQSDRDLQAAPTTRQRGCFAGKGFFDVLNYDDHIFLKRIPEISPICLVYMLFTMQQSGNVCNTVFQEAGRYIANAVPRLDRDSLGKLALVFAAARINNPGVFHIVAQEVNRRAAMRESELSLSTENLQDLFFAFGRSGIYNKDCMENLMLRTVSLFDADVTKNRMDPEYCAPAPSAAGRLVYAPPYTMAGLNTMLRGLADMKLLDKEFFDDVAEFTIHCLGQRSEIVDRFLGKAGLSIPGMMSVYVKTEMCSERVKELFDILAELVSLKSKLVFGESSRDCNKHLIRFEQIEEKEDRRLDRLGRIGERKRGAMGRYVKEEPPEDFKILRRDRARNERERLALMTEEQEREEVAKIEATHVPTRVLISGFKTDALLRPKEPPRERKQKRLKPTDVLEASLHTARRNIPKGNINEIRVYSEARTRKR